MSRYCLQPGCNQRVTTGRCPAHARNGVSQQQRYGSDWRAFREHAVNDTDRAVFPHAGPICVECERRGIITPMDELDHIIALAHGGAKLDPRNVQSLCRMHHQAKTAQEIADHHSAMAEGVWI